MPETKTFEELRKFNTFIERFNYLRLNGVVGDSTFGFDRYLNQRLYHSVEWNEVRDIVRIRDNGCDLGLTGYDIRGHIFVHHIVPLTIEDLEQMDKKIFDPNNLVCVSRMTHLAIHYGDETLLPKPMVVRFPGDTTPWR